MLIADYIDYSPAKVYDQGKTKTCVAHAFFTLLSEIIQQTYDENVEFDFHGIHAEMEKKRGKKKRIKWLCKTAKDTGFQTKDGRLVTIENYRRYFAYNRWDFLCEHIQSTGPQLIALNMYSGHKLNPKTTDIIEMPTEKQFKKKKKNGHMVMIRGFNRPRTDDGKEKKSWRLIKIQNSWGADDSVKWLPFDVFKEMVKYQYYLKGVKLHEKEIN